MGSSEDDLQDPALFFLMRDYEKEELKKGIKLRFSGLVAGTFTHSTILPTQPWLFLVFYFSKWILGWA